MCTRLRVKHRVWWPTSESMKAFWWTCLLFFTASLQVVNMIASTAPDFIAHFNNSFSAFVKVPGATPMAENFWSSCLLSDKLLPLSFLLSLSLQKIFQQSFSFSGDSSCNFPYQHRCHCHHRQTRLQGRLSESLATPPLLTLGALVTSRTSPPRRREPRGWALL